MSYQLSTSRHLHEDLTRWYDHFILDCEVDGLQGSSIEVYSRVMERFIAFAKKKRMKIAMHELNKGFFNEYLSNISHLAESHIYLHKTVIRKFLKFISNNNSDKYNFMPLIKALKPKELEIQKKEGLDGDTFRNFAASLNRSFQEGNFTHKRDAAMALIYLFTGVRTSELISLQLSHIRQEEERYVLLITQKGAKPHTVYLERSAFKAVMEFLTEGKGSEAFLLTNREGGRLTRNYVYKTITRILEANQIPHKGAHALRHILAQYLRGSGEKLDVVQSSLGHKKLTTTQRFYAPVGEDEKWEAAKRAQRGMGGVLEG